MPDLMDDFISTQAARAIYDWGIKRFRFVPVDDIVANPGRECPLRLAATADGIVGLLNGRRYPVAQRIKDFNRSDIDKAVANVKQKLELLFSKDSGVDPNEVVMPLAEAVDALGAQFDKVKVLVERTSQEYLSGQPRHELKAAQARMKAWTGDLENQLRRFAGDGRNVAMAAAVTIEHQAVDFKDPMVLTWSKFAVGDAAERLYRRGGDLPNVLQLRPSDNNLGSYLAFAATDLNKVSSGKGDLLTAFKLALKPVAAEKERADPARAASANFGMADIANQLGDAINRLGVAGQDDDLNDAVELAMVLAETVRGVLDEKPRGPDVSRADDQERDPQQFKRETDKAFEERRTFAEDGAKEVRTSPDDREGPV